VYQISQLGFLNYVRNNIPDFLLQLVLFTNTMLRTFVLTLGHGMTQSNLEDTVRYLKSDALGSLLLCAYDASLQLYALAFILMTIKIVTELLSYDIAMGETVQVLASMMYSALPVGAIYVILSLAIGVMWEGLRKRVLNPAQPLTWSDLFSGRYDHDRGHSRWLWLHEPLFHPFWAALGEVVPNGDSISGASHPFSVQMDHVVVDIGEEYWWALPVALVWCIVTSIFIVNLLIAKMTSTYESIRQRTHDYRMFQGITRILEYKDGHGPCPPPFLFFYDVLRWLCRNLRRSAFGHVVHDEAGYMVAVSFNYMRKIHKKTRVYLRECQEEADARAAETLDVRVEQIQSSLEGVKELEKGLRSVEAAVFALNERVCTALGVDPPPAGATRETGDAKSDGGSRRGTAYEEDIAETKLQVESMRRFADRERAASQPWPRQGRRRKGRPRAAQVEDEQQDDAAVRDAFNHHWQFI